MVGGCFLMLTIFIALPYVMFALEDRWAFKDAFHLLLVTIGLGDLVPAQPSQTSHRPAAGRWGVG